MNNLRERYIDTNGIRLHVMEAGPTDGPMVMFLHGFPEFWYAWRKQINYFAERGYLVIVPDQRGYNLSDKPQEITAYRIDELSKDILGLIDHYGRDRIFLVGHDWGAAVSWWVALNYPERLQRLVIMNAPHPVVFSKYLFENLKQMQKSWYVFYFQLPGAVEAFAAKSNYDWPVTLLATTSKPGTFTPEELEKYREAFMQPDAFTSMVNWYRASIQAPADRLADYTVRVPVLVLWGVRDVAIIPEQADETMALCDNGLLVKFDDCSHWIEHEGATTINPMIENYFKGAAVFHS